MAQDVFVQAWRGLPGFRADSTFVTWLHRITVNRSVSARRRRRPAPALVDPDSPSQDRSAEGIVEDRARVRALHRVVGALRAERRTVFVLRDLEGYSYDDIAALLEVTVPAVKSRLYRARIEVLRAMAEWT